eukprot:jgi/Orpsp1_1/1181402/evm.model.c7180000077088.1
MNSKNLKISEDEKLKYVFNALPQDYISKFILTKDDTFDTVYGKIEDDISRKSYIESWQNQNYNDDPMEIDYVKKEHNKNEKNNSKKNNKYCGICDSHSHDLKDCCNHKRNYSNKKGVHLIGKISDYDINDYYNANVGYEDIKTLFFDSDEDENYSNTLNNYKNKKINHVNLKNNINKNESIKKEKVILKCANNSPCTFEGHGEFHFFINSHKIILKRVLYSKDVSKNMISGVELAKIGIKAITEDINEDQLYIMKILKITYLEIFFSINKLNKESKLIWHRRLGHYYIENINEYLNIHNVKEPLCIDCQISKMKRKSHNKETPKAKDIIEVIHSDIIGPINDSYNGIRYIITFIDEKSHKSWIFLMKRKSEAINIIINFLKFLNNQFNDKKVKIFKSDNAREYRNKKIVEFCENNGIYKVYSPPYNPENNGMAERFNQTLISCAKTLLAWSKLSENFWDYAILYVNYLYNKTPHQSHQITSQMKVIINI